MLCQDASRRAPAQLHHRPQAALRRRGATKPSWEFHWPARFPPQHTQSRGAMILYCCASSPGACVRSGLSVALHRSQKGGAGIHRSRRYSVWDQRGDGAYEDTYGERGWAAQRARRPRPTPRGLQEQRCERALRGSFWSAESRARFLRCEPQWGFRSVKLVLRQCDYTSFRRFLVVK